MPISRSISAGAPYRVKSLAELLRAGESEHEIFSQIDELYDAHHTPEIPGNFMGTDEKWRRLMNRLQSCVYCLINSSGYLIGYWSCFPIIDDLYRRGIQGANINSSIDEQDLDELFLPGDIGYFVDLFTHKQHSNMATRAMLYRSFAGFLKSAARKGYFFRHIFAHTSSYDSINLCAKAGFELKCDHIEHRMIDASGHFVPTKIYDLDLGSIPPPKVLTLDDDLSRMYTDHYVGSEYTKAERNTKGSIEQLVADGESELVERKSTLRKNLRTGQDDDKMRVAVLKTIAGFLNVAGGTLIVGMGDSGELVGIVPDGFKSEDQMERHLIDLIKSRIGDVFVPFVHPRFADFEGVRLLLVGCDRGPRPAFVSDGSLKRFFVRGGSETNELVGDAIVDYTQHRFRSA